MSALFGAMFIALAPTAIAQGASAALPAARPSALDAFETAFDSLLAAEPERGFVLTLDVLEAASRGGAVDAQVHLAVRRDPSFLEEFVLALLPFEGVCDGIHCIPIRVYGSGEPFGRAGFVDIGMPSAERGRDRSLWWYSMYRPISVVVEIVDHSGRALHREAIRLRAADYTLPLGVSPGYAPQYVPYREVAIYGPVEATVHMRGVPEPIWQTAAEIEVTIVSDDVVISRWDADNLRSLTAFTVGVLVPAADAAELYIEPGVLLVEGHQAHRAILGPADPTTPWNASTIRRVENARVITHVNGVRVEPLEQLADVGFTYEATSVELTIWEQATQSSRNVGCTLPSRRNENERLVVPGNYPIFEAARLGGRSLLPTGGVFSRIVDLHRLSYMWLYDTPCIPRD